MRPLAFVCVLASAESVPAGEGPVPTVKEEEPAPPKRGVSSGTPAHPEDVAVRRPLIAAPLRPALSAREDLPQGAMSHSAGTRRRGAHPRAPPDAATSHRLPSPRGACPLMPGEATDHRGGTEYAEAAEREL